MPVAIEIYRTTPRPGGKELWGFEPSGAAPEPFAVVEAPDHVEVAKRIDGDTGAFLWPGSPGFTARLVYGYAEEGKLGLSLRR